MRANNSIKGMSTEFVSGLVLTSSTDGAVCNNCRPRIGELYQKQVRDVGRSFSSVYRILFRYLLPPIFKSDSLGCGLSVNGVKDPSTRCAM